MLGPVWDQERLDALYAGALTYLHGHSVGGTNPSLLRAMGAATATLAYDVSFNREVLGEDGRFWPNPATLAEQIRLAEADPESTIAMGTRLQQRAKELYNWEDVATKYESLATRLHNGGSQAKQFKGKRRTT